MRRAVSVLLFVLLAGCGTSPPRGEVVGTVRRDGKPLADVLVVFVPDPDKGTAGERASGKTGADGRFRLQGGAPGVVPGWYRIIVEDLAVYQAPRTEDGTLLEEAPTRFSPAYANPLETPLHKEVSAGSQVIDLDLVDLP